MTPIMQTAACVLMWSVSYAVVFLATVGGLILWERKYDLFDKKEGSADGKEQE